MPDDPRAALIAATDAAAARSAARAATRILTDDELDEKDKLEVLLKAPAGMYTLDELRGFKNALPEPEVPGQESIEGDGPALVEDDIPAPAQKTQTEIAAERLAAERLEREEFEAENPKGTAGGEEVPPWEPEPEEALPTIDEILAETPPPSEVDETSLQIAPVPGVPDPQPEVEDGKRRRTRYIVLVLRSLGDEAGDLHNAWVPVCKVDDYNPRAARKSVAGSLVEAEMRKGGTLAEVKAAVDELQLVACPVSSFQPEPVTLDLTLSVG